MIYKYLDQKRVTGKFLTAEQLKEYKCGEVEAVGELLKEVSEGIFIYQMTNEVRYSNVLFIPNLIDSGKDFMRENPLWVSQPQCLLEYYEAQGIDGILKSKADSLPVPPVVKLVGFYVMDYNNCVYVAQERNDKGEYRNVTIVPKGYLI